MIKINLKKFVDDFGIVEEEDSTHTLIQYLDEEMNLISQSILEKDKN